MEQVTTGSKTGWVSRRVKGWLDTKPVKRQAVAEETTSAQNTFPLWCYNKGKHPFIWYQLALVSLLFWYPLLQIAYHFVLSHPDACEMTIVPLIIILELID